MFDFLDSDWFIITLEIVFVILIAYDVKKYTQTKKKEYVTNIVLTLGFAIWTLYPMYKSYFGWDEAQKTEMLSTCHDSNNTELCKCVDDAIFKNYIYEEYKILDKNSTDYKEFLVEAKEECLDDSWF
ncbi:MAG: hypothetical protein U9Q29_03040 [Campylobacterota bacterium]|nr:hypothetical protein [Campylobacterota bacterium]